MAEYSDELLKRLWNRLREINDKDPKEYRLDPAGALIKWSDKGKVSEFGWHVDHACPCEMLKKYGIKEEDFDAEVNLRLFHYHNNEMKKDNYPKYTRARYYDSNKNQNVHDGVTRFFVNREDQKKILKKYSLPITLYFDGRKFVEY